MILNINLSHNVFVNINLTLRFEHSMKEFLWLTLIPIIYYKMSIKNIYYNNLKLEKMCCMFLELTLQCIIS